MHRKVAKKYLSRLLCDHLQEAVAKARIHYSKLDDLTERALSLVEDSTHKDHIYKEAGDMIFLFQANLEGMQDQLAVLSYVIEKMALTSAADDLNPSVRVELDKALQGGAKATAAMNALRAKLMPRTDIEEQQGFPTYIDETPPALKDEDEGLNKNVPKPAETDWSGFKTDFARPNVTDDMVP